jgi:tripartite-type tricarboxylate transporter receptor subunit TctC
MALRSAPEVVGRPYVMPPATPAELVQIMRTAFASAIKDPALRAEAKKAKAELDYTPGDKALEVMKEVLNQPKDVVEEFSKYIKFGE